MRVIYLDTLFLFNAAADLLCLSAAGKICGREVRLGRLLASSALGGGYAVLCVLPVCGFLSGAAGILLSAAAICAAAFGKKRFFRTYLAFLAASAAFGGTVFAVSRITGAGNMFSSRGTLTVFLLSAGLARLCFSAAYGRFGKARSRGGEATVEIWFRGRKTVLRALRDTGHSLRDPVTGEEIAICETARILTLFPAETRNLLERGKDAVDLVSRAARTEDGIRFRLVPYRAVGTKLGLLAAFSPDRILIDGKERKRTLIAMTDVPLSESGAYGALIRSEGET